MQSLHTKLIFNHRFSMFVVCLLMKLLRISLLSFHLLLYSTHIHMSGIRRKYDDEKNTKFTFNNTIIIFWFIIQEISCMHWMLIDLALSNFIERYVHACIHIFFGILSYAKYSNYLKGMNLYSLTISAFKLFIMFHILWL